MKIKVVLAFLLTTAVLFLAGCEWPWQQQPDTSEPEVSIDGFTPDVVQVGGLRLENIRELPFSSDGMVASMYDGNLTWSPDGELVAIGMSNLTLASAQTQLVDVNSGERKAVVSGYNLHWDPEDPEKIIFTRHQYYGPPDYGSFEETISVNQSDLLAAGDFRDDIPHEVIGTGEITVTEGTGSENILQTAAWDDQEIIIKVVDGKPSLYLSPGGDSEIVNLLVSEDVIVDAFALNPAGDKIIYREVKTDLDELGNWEADDSNTRFLIADLKKTD